MIRKIVVRKLNRTQLKKEGTKEIYLTGKGLLEFFGFADINELSTRRNDPKAQKLFFLKSQYYSQLDPQPLYMSVTKENDEVRFTGFSEYLPFDIKETDSMVLEAIENSNGEVVYLLDFIKSENILVLQAYSEKDDLVNYTQNINSRGNIQLEFISKTNTNSKSSKMYWLWDSRENLQIPIDLPIKAKINYGGLPVNKTIRFKDSGQSFKKLMKAMSNSNRKIEFQEKKLYIIEELISNDWMPLSDINYSVLELIFNGSFVMVLDRYYNSFTYCWGKTL